MGAAVEISVCGVGERRDSNPTGVDVGCGIGMW